VIASGRTRVVLVGQAAAVEPCIEELGRVADHGLPACRCGGARDEDAGGAGCEFRRVGRRERGGRAGGTGRGGGRRSILCRAGSEGGGGGRGGGGQHQGG